MEPALDAAEKSEDVPESKDARTLPRNKLGAVDEWLAVEQQKQRAIQVYVQQQKDQAKAAKKLYK